MSAVEAPIGTNEPGPVRRGLMGIVALALLYGNAAVALAPPPLRRIGLAIPAPDGVRDAFMLTGMFNSYSVYNRDFVLAGLPQYSEDRSPKGWFKLPLREYFPQRAGITFTQVFAAHHWDAHGRAAQRRAWATLAAKIRRRHNRLHPERPITRVRIGALRWPISPLGYRALKTREHTTPELWFSEEP